MACIIDKQPSSRPENEQSAQSYNKDCEDQLKLGRFMIKKMNIPKGARVLDIGCGPGPLTVDIADGVGPTGSVVGIDVSEVRIKMALQTYTDPALDTYRANASFLLGDAHSLAQFPDNHFDFVVASAVIHYLNLPVALKEICRVLKPGGRFAATTISGDYPCAPFDIKKEVQSRDYYRAHIEPTMDLVFLPKQSDLEKYFYESGFQGATFDVIHSTLVRKDPEALINFVDASCSGTYIRAFPEAIQATAWADFEAELEKLRTERGIEVEYYSLTAYATKA
ncbi:hypothetical protein SEPCBS119000_003668 [Sporothrix epigloea]|uniref:Methyltransferase domain-containing protein n=1 Tax=Sporothrix epigloea TaxID=1892477 RepID=A0ABP0DMZ7_9PEZI